MSKKKTGPKGKAPSFPHYPGDEEADTTTLPVDEFGAWRRLINYFWKAPEKGIFIGTWGDLAAMFKITGADAEREAERLVRELFRKKICNLSVTCNANVTPCNDHVTVVCRRIVREEKIRKQTRLRVQNLRSKDNGNASVAEMKRSKKGVPSSSSSSSSSNPTLPSDNRPLQKEPPQPASPAPGEGGPGPAASGSVCPVCDALERPCADCEQRARENLAKLVGGDFTDNPPTGNDGTVRPITSIGAILKARKEGAS